VFRIRIDLALLVRIRNGNLNPNLYKKKFEKGEQRNIKLSVCLIIWIRFRIFVVYFWIRIYTETNADPKQRQKTYYPVLAKFWKDGYTQLLYPKETNKFRNQKSANEACNPCSRRLRTHSLKKFGAILRRLLYSRLCLGLHNPVDPHSIEWPVPCPHFRSKDLD